MSISGTNVLTVANYSFNSDLVTSAFTPDLSKLYLLTVVNIATGTFPFTPAISTTNGLTFSLITSELTGGASDAEIWVYRAMISSGASNGTITIGATGSIYDAFLANLDVIDGVDTSGSNGANAIVQYAVNQGGDGTTSLAATLGAFGSASNGTFASAMWWNRSGFNITDTASTGFTELCDYPGSRYNINTRWRADNNLTTTVTETDSGPGAGGKAALIALEIKASGGGGGGGGAGQPNSMLQFGIGA